MSYGKKIRTRIKVTLDKIQGIANPDDIKALRDMMGKSYSELQTNEVNLSMDGMSYEKYRINHLMGTLPFWGVLYYILDELRRAIYFQIGNESFGLGDLEYSDGYNVRGSLERAEGLSDALISQVS